MLALLVLLLSLVILVWAVDYDQDDLPDDWEATYGFATNGYRYSDMIAWWQLDHTNGTTATDRSSKNKSLTLIGGAAWTNPGLFGKAVNLDGVNDFLQPLTGTNYNLSNFTFSIWLRTTNLDVMTLPHWHNSVSGWGMGVSNGIAAARFDTTNLFHQWVLNTNSQNLVNDGQWHHVAVVYDRDNDVARIYVDGTLDYGTNLIGKIGTNNNALFRIGFMAVGTNFRGDLDEIRIYSTALASNEIALLPNTYTDSDGDGWNNLTEYNNGTNPLLADTDGDGQPDGTDPYPLDYYNNVLPLLSIESGNNQVGFTNTFLVNPIVVSVRDTNSVLLTNAPLTFAITQGGGLVAEATNITPLASLDVRTGTNGRGSVYWQLGSVVLTNHLGTVTAWSGTNSTSQSFAATTEPLYSDKIFAADLHSLAISANNELYAWGNNDATQLSIGTNDLNYWYPGRLTDLGTVRHFAGSRAQSYAVNSTGTIWKLHFPRSVLTNMSEVARLRSGYEHFLLVQSNGVLWAWGNNDGGQLGDGTLSQRNSPVTITGITNVINADGGYRHSIAIKNDGTLWTWGQDATVLGYNYAGDQQKTPVQLSGYSNFVAAAAGYVHNVALKSDGTVWTWGYNTQGQLGDGTTTAHQAPAVVPGLSNVVWIDAGYYHTAALKSDGTVWMWGNNDEGELGDTTTTDRTSPVQTSNLVSVASFKAGGYHMLLAKTNGTLMSWGYNPYGQLGDGTQNNRNSPTNVVQLAVSERVEMPTFSPDGGAHWPTLNVTISCATAGATIRYTTTGIDPTESDSSITSGSSIAVSGNTILKARAYKSGLYQSQVKNAAYQVFNRRVAAGHWHNHVLLSDGSLWSWGNNTAGQLGTGDTNSYPNPTLISSVGALKEVSASRQSSWILKTNGTVWQLYTNNPQVAGLSNIVRIAGNTGNDEFRFALHTNTTLWAWGDNTSSQLGWDNGGNQVSTPAQVPGLTNILYARGGERYSVALKNDGTVWTAGRDTYGVLGNGRPTTGFVQSAFLQVGTIHDVVAVEAGYDHAIALKADGTVWSWGRSDSGQLGNGTNLNYSVPTQATGLSNVVAVAAGRVQSFALKSDGTLWAWGRGVEGQLGDGANTNKLSPVQILSPSNVVMFSGGMSHSLASRSDGTFWITGTSLAAGELGIGTVSSTNRFTTLRSFDSDSDGLEDWEEIFYGSDTSSTDSNFDGIDDGISAEGGINPADTDLDDDGLSNAVELLLGTDMFNADTDGDGVNDGADAFPLDSTRSSAPSGVPGDVTPPSINLTEPQSAILL